MVTGSGSVRGAAQTNPTAFPGRDQHRPAPATDTGCRRTSVSITEKYREGSPEKRGTVPPCASGPRRTHPSQCQPGWTNGVQDGQLWLAYQTQQPSILLAPLTAAEKIPLSSRTGSGQPLEASKELTSSNAHRREVATAPLADHQPVTRCSDTP
jgi:hypothetical protein